METEKKFKEKYLAGEIAFEEIDDYSQEPAANYVTPEAKMSSQTHFYL